MQQLTGNEYKTILEPREQMSHKGTFGTLGLVVGSKCYQGAACLASKSALVSGVGIACAFIPECIYIPFASKINGAVIESLDCSCGCIDDEKLCKKLYSRNLSAVLCGSGIGLTDGAAKAVKTVSSMDLPVVFDGDALTIISKDIELLNRNNTTILTPHIGEFSRLCGKNASFILSNMEREAIDFAMKHNCIVVLKSSTTVIASPSGDSYLLCNPTSALSKGGSGDILAGITASFLAQGTYCVDAVIAAVTLHNTCGHLAADTFGERATLAEDITDQIRKLVI